MVEYFNALGKNDIYCVRGGVKAYPTHVWWEENPFEFIMPVTMLQLLMFSITFLAIHFVIRPFHQTKFVSHMLAGLIVGSFIFTGKKSWISKFYPNEQTVVRYTLSQLGISLYMFIVTVKIDFNMILRIGKETTLIGMAGFFTPFTTIMSLLFSLAHIDPQLPKGMAAVVMTVAFSNTACPNLAAALDDLDLLSTDLGQLGLSASLINDAIMWCFIVTTVIAKQEASNFLNIIFYSTTLLIVGIFIIRPIMFWIIKRTPPGQPVRDVYIIILFVSVLGFRVIGELCCGNAYVGAILFGLVTPSGPPLGSILVEKAEAIILVLFLPFFYLEVATYLDLSTSTMSWKGAVAFQLIIVAGYVAKFFGIVVVSLCFGKTVYDSIILSLIMNARGLLEVLVYKYMASMKVIDARVYATLLLSATIGTLMVTPLIKIMHRSRQNQLYDESTLYHGRTIQTTDPISELRIISCIHNESNVPSIVTLIEASNPTKSTPICAYVIHMIELVGRATPLIMPHKKHGRMCEHNGCIPIMSAFDNYFKTSNKDGITIQPFTMMSPYKTMHEGVIRISQEKKSPLIIVPFMKNDAKGGVIDGALTIIPSKLQQHAPCSVGVLVDRGMHVHRIQHHLTYRVVVIFIGGKDDREALAFGARMSGHPSVSVTVLRIVLKEDQDGRDRGDDDEDMDGHDEEKECESKLDALWLEEFRFRSMNSSCVTFHHIVVGDWEQGMKAIRSASSDGFDLILVGKRQHSSSWLQDEMESWVDNPELGLVGDMLASSNFSDGKTSVLVLQHYGSQVRRLNSSVSTTTTTVMEDERSRYYSAASTQSAYKL